MLKLKKSEAFRRAVELWGPWKGWARAQHLAYGLARGVPYEKMERCSNDDPWAWTFARCAWELGLWPELVEAHKCKYSVPREVRNELRALVVWKKKEPRTKRERPSKREVEQCTIS